MSGDDAMTRAVEAVGAAATEAHRASPSLATATDGQIDAALRAMARLLVEAAEPVLAANREDHRAAVAGGMGGGLLDRLRLDEARLREMGDQLLALADIPAEPARRPVRRLDDDLVVQEWRRPVGVIGANFEARPNVVVDIASQLVKSRNAGVLRTGSAALGSAVALIDHVVAPALAEAGLDPAAVQLLRLPGRESAAALVRQPRLLPLVILRGSGRAPAAWPSRRRWPGCEPWRTPTGVRCSTCTRPPTGGVRSSWSSGASTGWACATGSTCCWSTPLSGTSWCRPCWTCSPGTSQRSPPRCRRTSTRSASSGRSTTATRRP
ncbi:aldehyde dehydrogenase family protein [Micromonospora zhanjiangensis]